jgi:hypothetical protein
VKWDSTRFEGYQSNVCFWCQEKIPLHTAVSFSGKGSWDRIDCAICRIPVCDRCCLTWWVGDEDIGYRYRLCQACQNDHPEFASRETVSQAPVRSKFCHHCQTVTQDETIRCSACPKTLCKACTKAWNKKPVCPDCLADHLNRPPCASCHQVPEYDHITCPTCGKQVCRSCSTYFDESYCHSCAKAAMDAALKCAACKNAIPSPLERNGEICYSCKKQFCEKCISRTNANGVTYIRCFSCESHHRQKALQARRSLVPPESFWDRLKKLFFGDP